MYQTRLANFISTNLGIYVSPDALFDVHVLDSLQN